MGRAPSTANAIGNHLGRGDGARRDGIDASTRRATPAPALARSSGSTAAGCEHLCETPLAREEYTRGATAPGSSDAPAARALAPRSAEWGLLGQRGLRGAGGYLSGSLGPWYAGTAMRQSRARWVVGPMAAGAFLLVGLAACNPNEKPYEPVPAWSGKAANIPSPPQLPKDPIKDGDAFTVRGSIHHLRSRFHAAEVTSKEITIVGYIVDSNIPRAPKCAVHKTGKEDPEDCVTEIPTFVIADKKETDPEKGKAIKVMGWASNFANVFEAMQKYKGKKEAPSELYQDELWGVPVPFPLPAKGAKVKVTGTYGVNFSKASSGIASDPMRGILTYSKLEVVEEAPEAVAFSDGK